LISGKIDLVRVDFERVDLERLNRETIAYISNNYSPTLILPANVYHFTYIWVWVRRAFKGQDWLWL